MKLTEPMLIIFDGLDNCGKTTQIKRLYSYIKYSGNKVTMMSPPSNELRTYLKNIKVSDELNYTLSNDNIKKALCYKSFSMAYEYNKTIRSLLDGDTTVLLDRWLFSTYIYNCITPELKRTCLEVWKETLGKIVTFNFFINTDLKTCIERGKQEEKDNISFLSTEDELTKVYNRYVELSDNKDTFREKYITELDGNKSTDEIFADILIIIIHDTLGEEYV